VQVDPIKPTLKPTGTRRLNLKCDILLSTSAFKFNLGRYTMAHQYDRDVATTAVGRCRLTL
jgi:hypothetical protein